MFYHLYEKIVNTSVHFINKLLLVWPITQTFISNVVTIIVQCLRKMFLLPNKGNIFLNRGIYYVNGF